MSQQNDKTYTFPENLEKGEVMTEVLGNFETEEIPDLIGQACQYYLIAHASKPYPNQGDGAASDDEFMEKINPIVDLLKCQVLETLGAFADSITMVYQDSHAPVE